MKRFLSILLALILALSLLPMQAMAATVISSVAVTLDAPIVGASPDYTTVLPTGVHYYSEDYSGNYIRNDVQWNEADTNTWLLPDSAVFQAGHQYRVMVFLTPEDGYEFAGATTATLNGQAASAYYLSSGQLEVVYTFPAASEPVISSVAVTLDAPAVGASPDYTANFPAGVHYYSDEFNGTFLRNDIQWKDVTANTWMNPDSAVFQSGHEYMVSLYLTAQSGFSFGGDLTAAVNGQTASASMGGSQLAVTYVFPALPDLSTCATVILTAEDVWGDGSGYQMLLDADATAYGTLIPDIGALTVSSGDAPAGLYDEFEYKIPQNADGSLTTQNIVLDNSVSIQIPAGTYDFCITNPTPGDKIYIASGDGADGRKDDFVFEAGRTYEFKISPFHYTEKIDLEVSVSPGVAFPLWVCGTQVTAENMDNILEDNYTVHQAVFTPALGDEPNKLTLTNASIQFAFFPGSGVENSAGIYSDGMDLTLELDQLSAVNGNDRENVSGVFVDGADLTIRGNGSLYVFPGNSDGSSFGLRADNITMEGGIVRIRGGDAADLSTGVYAEEGFAMNGGSLSSTGGEAGSSFGIYGGPVALRSGTVEFSGNTRACALTPILTEYADPYVTVNAAAAAEGAAPWNGTAALGGSGSAYKYVKVESDTLRYPVIEPFSLIASVEEHYFARIGVVSGTGAYPYTFSFSGLPDWLEYDNAFNILSGTPTETGSFPFTVTVTDAKGMTATEDVAVVVLAERPSATVILTSDNVWGDGSGYQLLLDADATAYGILIPEIGGLSDYGSDAPAGLYDEFEYKIPENADGSLTTQNIVINNSVSIQIPAGTYDYCITNPTPGDRVWIAGSSGSAAPRGDNFVFEAGKTYEFTVSSYGSGDGVDLVITGSPDLTGVPASVTSLSAQVSGEAITLTWPAAANAAFYKVARHEYGCPWETLAENVTANSYVDSGAEPGYAYAYRVWACNDQGAAAPAESDYVTIPLQLPGAISSVSAQVSDGKIIVTWSAAENADCYMVARQVAGSPWVILSSDVTGTSFEDSTVEAGQSYIYLVEGRNSHGYGDYTLSESVTFAASKPGDIVSVTATAEPELITVTWPEAEYAARYVVARQVSGASGWTVLDNDVTENLYEDDDVEAGKTYRYRVRAYNAQGSGAAANSEYVTVPASKPGDIVSVTAAASAGKITVSWPAAEYAARYAVARQVLGSGSWKSLATDVTDTSFEDTTAEAGKSYRYRVRAYNDQGSGGAADSAYVTALAAKPGDIASVTATASAGKITVSWPAAAYAARYAVARQVSGSGSWKSLATDVTDTSFEDTTAEA
ncbi:MAG: DUF2436 domain-containing protein, partial [Oscillospiraceae bacterium]|nr:DUF2436 domain-containing protein [Oscillospiraceae bacterium]